MRFPKELRPSYEIWDPEWGSQMNEDLVMWSEILTEGSLLDGWGPGYGVWDLERSSQVNQDIIVGYEWGLEWDSQMGDGPNDGIWDLITGPRFGGLWEGGGGKNKASTTTRRKLHDAVVFVLSSSFLSQNFLSLKSSSQDVCVRPWIMTCIWEGFFSVVFFFFQGAFSSFFSRFFIPVHKSFEVGALCAALLYMLRRGSEQFFLRLSCPSPHPLEDGETAGDLRVRTEHGTRQRNPRLRGREIRIHCVL